MNAASRTSRNSIQEGTSEWELFLLLLRYREGRLVEMAGNKPILLDDPGVVWIVYTGVVSLFRVELEAPGNAGRRHYLARAEPGHALFGIAPIDGDDSVHLLAAGPSGTQVIRLARTRLVELSLLPEYQGLISSLVDDWLNVLSAAVVSTLPPRDYHLLEPNRKTQVSGDSVLRTRSEVLWVAHEWGSSRFSDVGQLPPITSDKSLPLAGSTWLTTTGPSIISTLDTLTALTTDNVWTNLDCFHNLVLQLLTDKAAATSRSDVERLSRKTEAETELLRLTSERLASILTPGVLEKFAGTDIHDPLLAACQIVGAELGVNVRKHSEANSSKFYKDPVRDIAQASRLRVRQVQLTDGWWKFDNGPLVGFLGEDEQPVALLRTSRRGYKIHDPVSRCVIDVTPATASVLTGVAYSFYPPLTGKSPKPGDVLQFGLRGAFKDVRTIAGAGIAAGVVGLIVPVLTGVIFDQIIPAAQAWQLLPITLALVMGALGIALFGFVRGIALLRIETHAESTFQAAVIDRLLNLPAAFFRDYTAGDLGQRAMGISALRATLSRTALPAMLSLLFSVFSLVILFVYSVHLALVAIGIVVILTLILGLSAYQQKHYQQLLATQEGKVSGIVLQLIRGIGKLRVAGAERRAFARWANQFAIQRRLAFQARSVGNVLTVVNQVYPLLTSMAIFGMVALSSKVGLSTGRFIAFNAAFGQFLAAMLSVSGAIASALVVLPLYERVQPILVARPEVDTKKSDPGELTGRIEVSRVTFRYHEDGPAVLNDVSMHLEPGEFVALVGPSGSGKSTLLRLLLGFERLQSGAILYDGQNLAELNVQAVRQQMGVVLQDGQPMSGDILGNIVGVSQLTLDDAWRAAEMAGLADDIRQLPMGMYTVMGEGGSTFSAGQIQRLLIARAIARKPRILLFDEATSALDNQTQEIVSRNLNEFEATRIVVAHRLNTIQKADCIYVFHNGRVVQSGTYEHLISRRGLFADLARRQVT